MLRKSFAAYVNFEVHRAHEVSAVPYVTSRLNSDRKIGANVAQAVQQHI